MTKWAIEIDGVVQDKTVWAYTNIQAVNQAAGMYHVSADRVHCYPAD